MFYQLLEKGIDFVVRLPQDGMLKDAMAFLQENRRDKIMTLEPPATLRGKLTRLGLPVLPPIRLRIVKARTAPGKTVLYATSLQDKNEIKASDLRQLYRLRWEDEEFLKLIKEFLQAEGFRGRSGPLIGQDDKQAIDLLNTCLAQISRQRYKKRPGRKYPRKSRSRHGKWAMKYS